jgi:molybdate transport system permease protein
MSGGQEARDTTLLVLAAASLVDVLPQVAALWSDAGGVPVTFSFDATSRLAPQTLQGTSADLFFSADERWMEWVRDRGGVREETVTDLLGNGLVLITPGSSAGGGSGIEKPLDLADSSVRHVALAGEDVPGGRYAQAALQSTGVWDRISGKVVRAGNVRRALEWVALAEAQAGVVYRTDALSDNRVRIPFTFEPWTHPPIRYPAAVLSTAPRARQAEEFLRFCRTPAAEALFEAAGFQILLEASPAEAGPEGVGSGSGPSSVPDPWSAIRLSLWVALSATLLSFVPAVWLGWLLARREFTGKTLVTTLALVPLVLPPVVTGFILLSLFGARSPLGSWLAGMGLPIPFTLLGATLAALTVGFPLYVLSIRNAFQTVDPSYEAVAWTLGRKPWPTFLRVTFPLALPGIAAGAVLSFARALGEFGATVVLAGNVEGRTRTIALAVYTLLESPRGREAIWLLVGASVVLSLLALLGFEALSRHQRRQMEVHHGP